MILWFISTQSDILKSKKDSSQDDLEKDRTEEDDEDLKYIWKKETEIDIKFYLVFCEEKCHKPCQLAVVLNN